MAGAVRGLGLDHLAVVIVVGQIRVVGRGGQHRQHLGVGVGIVVLAGVLEHDGVVVRIGQAEGHCPGRHVRLAVDYAGIGGIGVLVILIAHRAVLPAAAEAQDIQILVVAVIISPVVVSEEVDIAVAVQFGVALIHPDGGPADADDLLAIAGEVRRPGAPFDIEYPLVDRMGGFITNVECIGTLIHQIQHLNAAGAVPEDDAVHVDAGAFPDAIEFAHGQVGRRVGQARIVFIIGLGEVGPAAVRGVHVLGSQLVEVRTVPAVDGKIPGVPVGGTAAAAHDQLIAAVVVHVPGGQARPVDGPQGQLIAAGHHLAVVRAHQHDGLTCLGRALVLIVAVGDGQIVDAILVDVRRRQAHHIGNQAVVGLGQVARPRLLPVAVRQERVAGGFLQLPDGDGGGPVIAVIHGDLVDAVAVKVAHGQIQIVVGRVRIREVVVLFVIVVSDGAGEPANSSFHIPIVHRISGVEIQTVGV